MTELFKRANRVIPGGVNSPVRAFGGVGGDPVFIASANGCELSDVNGKTYIDYVGSWGPMILGHAHPAILDAITQQAQRGVSYGAPCQLEVELAEKVCQLMPAIEKIRMVNSGTEATMSAIRLARGITGRQKLVKFSGCYHGHADSLLVEAGSGVSTLGIPSSQGVLPDTAAQTLTANFNDIESVQTLFDMYADDIAAIIVEPIAGNMNCIVPDKSFLLALRKLCDRHHSLLIFDEVMTGFRVALGGAQAHFDIQPDLTTLGKIIGGGLPVGAFGGKAELMDHLAPVGKVYQAGTLSGNPLAMAAGLATLRQLERPRVYEKLGQTTQRLTTGLQQLANKAGVPFSVEAIGGMFGLFFNENKAKNYKQAQQGSLSHFQSFFHHMLQQGIYLAPSAYEAGFVSTVHTSDVITATLSAAEYAFGQLS